MTVDTSIVKTKQETLASDFLLAFYREFEEAAKKPDTDAYFILSVEDFDLFLVTGGYLAKMPSEAATPEEKSGLKLHRNVLRAELNRASKRGRHGSPFYSVNTNTIDKTLRVELEVLTAVNSTPKAMADVVGYVENKVRSIKADLDFISTANIPGSIKEDILRGGQSIDILMSAFTPALKNFAAMLEDGKTRALNWVATNDPESLPIKMQKAHARKMIAAE